MLIISINTLFYFVYFNFSEIEVKAKACFHLLKHDKVADQEIITIAAKQFNAKEHELWYSGKLYDVASYTISGDSARVIVWHDRDEEQLVNNNTSYFSQMAICNYDLTHIQKQHYNDINNWYFFLPSIARSPLSIPSALLLYPPILLYNSQYAQIITPPPQLHSC